MHLILALFLLAGISPEPTDAGGWFRLGIAKHDAGDLAGAIAAYQKAEALHFAQPVALYVREARAFAKAGRKDEAFAALKHLTDLGFGSPEMLDAQNDLLSIRLDPRYGEAIEAAKKNAHPCSAPEFRQFDFWIGEWDVEVGGAKVAYSSIQLILNECVIFENYSGQRNYAGKSFSLYDAAHKRWEQRYVDTGGAFHEWTDGGLTPEGAMRFLWHKSASLDRMTYTKEGPDAVRQLIETSTDGGKTWATTYDGHYTRRK